VQLKPAPAATYRGGVPGYAATRPSPGRRFDRRSGAVDSYAAHLERLHDDLLAEVGAQGTKIYSFRFALNGFAASLTAAQAAALAQHELVRRVWLDADRKVETNNSSIFLGLLDAHGGLRADLKLTGEDVVVGIIDSGIAPNHPSLRDLEPQIPSTCQSPWAKNSWLGLWLCHSVRNNPPTTSTYGPVSGFSGICEAGEGFTAEDCNNKVVGARYYIDGFLRRHTLDDGEFVSPKDADGHGTHIATIIAGNSVSATLFGVRVAQVSGIAPRARIAVYKACWVRPGDVRATCTTADLARAIDDAVADGVDIINYSVGSLETDLTAPDDLALLNALDAGVLSVVAAGNDGPELGTIGSPSSAPWVLTVAASTQSGTTYAEAIEITSPTDLAGRILMQEASFTRSLSTAGPIEGELALADDGQTVLPNGSLGTERDACEPLINAAEIAGLIALIERGNCDFEVKLEHAEQAGAAAVIVYNNNGLPIVMNGTPGSVAIPGVMVSTADGQRLLNRLISGDAVMVRLEKGLFLERSSTGNQIADFSSRGPALSEADFLKPDVTAPGVDILAGHTSDVANGLRGEQFQYLSGTSMSTPETAGVAALLKQAHPDWGPGALKSALMTTARQNVVEQDLETAAHPFEIGAGHVVPNRAIEPGLVYDTGYLDYAAYLCGLDRPPFVASDCDILRQAGYSFAPRDVNLPSIGVTELISGDVIRRRVTNLGAPASYSASINAPFGMEVFIEPPTLSLGTGESGEFDIRFETTTPDLDLWTFGDLVWSSDTDSVRSPMAVRPVTLRAPTELELLGTEGSGTYDVAFGYNGEYDSSIHGLNSPFLLVDDGFVDDDPTNSFSFRQGNGVTQHWFTVAPDDFYLRVALFDELTDGADDLDLYLYFCPESGNCIQIAESGSFTSTEQIDIPYPFPGQYTVLVHGYETDQVSGGPGAHYSLFAWSLSDNDPGGNLEITIPTTVEVGDRYNLDISWGPLDAETRYFGGILHFTPNSIEPYSITLVTARTP
jgi:subtilisin family serine protease